MEVPVYVCTGFLESGKTTFIKDTLVNQDFMEDGLTLLLVCEEGEEEFDKEFLKKYQVQMLSVEEPEQLNPGFFKNCDRAYRPAQVIIEWNGTWDVKNILEMEYPKGWQVEGVYSTVDATTMEMYMTNMRKMFLEPLFQSELIILNRCTEETNRSLFRRTVKASNPQVQFIFEDTDGNIMQQGEEDLPFDRNADFIDLEDMDYGIWYLDASEHPEAYDGKRLRFRAQVYTSLRFKKGMFVPGRFVMTCCIQDTRFMGYVCHYEGNLPYKKRDWVMVTVKFKFEYSSVYREKGPVLYLESIEKADKAEQDPASLS
ncbi:MAG: GTP-binding protein [Candidatus Limivivens sp.]|nr:GTP-binding protein [Candidatus Limivivens sp.]